MNAATGKASDNRADVLVRAVIIIIIIIIDGVHLYNPSIHQVFPGVNAKKFATALNKVLCAG